MSVLTLKQARPSLFFAIVNGVKGDVIEGVRLDFFTFRTEKRNDGRWDLHFQFASSGGTSQWYSLSEYYGTFDSNTSAFKFAEMYWSACRVQDKITPNVPGSWNRTVPMS